jgi:tRNA pseudouridine13 synthase
MKLMTEERMRLEKEKAKFPELFPETTWVDDGPFLEALGIHIPHKDQLSRGFLKILPGDFIVEEIDESGKQTNITKDDSENKDLPGETVYATLVKCGLSTLEAVEEIAKILGIQKDKVQYAGIKDKDAITSQQISFRGVNKEDVLEISSPHFFLKNVRTGKGVVQKGGLRGNKFSILIRTESDSNEENHVEMSLKALERVKKEGFYNFFYLQRFGTPRLNNYKWGISILRGLRESSAWTYLRPRAQRNSLLP